MKKIKKIKKIKTILKTIILVFKKFNILIFFNKGMRPFLSEKN